MSVKDNERLLELCMSDENLSEIKELILSKKVKVNYRGDKGYTPLMTSSFSGAKKVLLFLLSCNANINAVDEYGATALLIAIANKNFKIAMYLIENICDKQNAKRYLNIEDNYGLTPLHCTVMNSAEKGCSSFFDYLLSKSDIIDFNYKNKLGKTAYDYALEYNSIFTNILKSKTELEELNNCIILPTVSNIETVQEHKVKIRKL